MSKQEEVYNFVQKKALTAIAMVCAEHGDRTVAETIRANRDRIATRLAWEIREEYGYLELADIMEWRKTRVRR